jgi:endonuclease/exonuclease/phosphatase family metal-dependent hydrolase
MWMSLFPFYDTAPDVPRQVLDDLTLLNQALDETIPHKVLDRNLLIATWNIRNFGGLTPKWISSKDDSPQRDLESAFTIAEIISRFDVVAIQEVKSDTTALKQVCRFLGEHWSLILTDVTEGNLGNQERMAFLFDTRRVQLSGLACELVIPPEYLEKEQAEALRRQFARTPYAVGFKTLGHTFTLVELHVIWGDSENERVQELNAIAYWLAKWSRDKNAWDHNLITLGDFNIEQEQSVYADAFSSTGLYIPSDLRGVQRSIFEGKVNQPLAFYDQIAWFEDVKGARPLSLKYRKGGSFNFTKVALQSRNLKPADLSWCISDHLPLWVEFGVA